MKFVFYRLSSAHLLQITRFLVYLFPTVSIGERPRGVGVGRLVVGQQLRELRALHLRRPRLYVVVHFLRHQWIVFKIKLYQILRPRDSSFFFPKSFMFLMLIFKWSWRYIWCRVSFPFTIALMPVRYHKWHRQEKAAWVWFLKHILFASFHISQNLVL